MCQATERTREGVITESRRSAPPIEYRNDIGMKHTRFEAPPNPVEKFNKVRDRNVIVREKATNASNQKRANIKVRLEKNEV